MTEEERTARSVSELLAVLEKHQEAVWLVRAPAGKWLVLDADEDADAARAAGLTVRKAVILP